ncbi:MAG TPA: VOC family protein [Vicinamibacterales bacterium]
MSARLGRVHLRVSDLDRACRFYTRVLGLRIASREPGQVSLSSPDGRNEVALHAGTSESPLLPVSVGARFVGFEVDKLAALVSVCERLGGARAHVVDYGDSWSVHTSDPDGNGVEIYCHLGTDDGAQANQLGRTASLQDLRAAARGETLSV